MHYLTLITAEIPHLEEDEYTNNAIKEQIALLENDPKSDNHTSNLMNQYLISQYKSKINTFARAVDTAAEDILEQYDVDFDDPDYLEFWDKTEEIVAAYGKTVDCIRLPEGRVVCADDYRLRHQFVIKDGIVYEQNVGPLHHDKRTKRAKRMKPLPNYPVSSLYQSLSEFADKWYGVRYYEKENGYGYYYNPDAFYDWYNIGGRWPDLFLVKDDCTEYSIGEYSWAFYGEEFPAPEGYKWVCAARKKDIDWQAIKDWHLKRAISRFESLEKLFLTGERDENIRGEVTEEGIMFYNRLLYSKGETVEEYLKRHNQIPTSHYPVCFYGFLGEDGWHTEADIILGPNKNPDDVSLWKERLDNFLDSIPDDTVLIGVDCHM